MCFVSVLGVLRLDRLRWRWACVCRVGFASFQLDSRRCSGTRPEPHSKYTSSGNTEAEPLCLSEGRIRNAYGVRWCFCRGSSWWFCLFGTLASPDKIFNYAANGVALRPQAAQHYVTPTCIEASCLLCGGIILGQFSRCVCVSVFVVDFIAGGVTIIYPQSSGSRICQTNSLD